jgi:hypothetical protein
MEKLIKQKLTDRGFTKEIILNNRGLISAVIEELKAAISVTRCCETLPSLKELEFIASEESQQDWNDLRFKQVYKDGFNSCAMYIHNSIVVK